MLPQLLLNFNLKTKLFPVLASPMAVDLSIPVEFAKYGVFGRSLEPLLKTQLSGSISFVSDTSHVYLEPMSEIGRWDTSLLASRSQKNRLGVYLNVRQMKAGMSIPSRLISVHQHMV